MSVSVKTYDVTLLVNALLATLILGFTAFLIYSATQPHQAPKNPWDGCELIASVKTEERRYCGKACSMPVFADTYQCKGDQKTFLDSRWEIAKP